MRILGAILAGGQSRRFGSDKALALHDGRRLIDHVADALRPQVDELILVGRASADGSIVADLPQPGMGPIGGLAGALNHARHHGFDAVLTCGCDILGVPADLVSQLGAPPAIVADMPIVGLWPQGVAGNLLRWIKTSDRHSVYAFADHCGAHHIRLRVPLRNINRQEDLL